MIVPLDRPAGVHEVGGGGVLVDDLVVDRADGGDAVHQRRRSAAGARRPARPAPPSGSRRKTSPAASCRRGRRGASGRTCRSGPCRRRARGRCSARPCPAGAADGSGGPDRRGRRHAAEAAARNARRCTRGQVHRNLLAIGRSIRRVVHVGERTRRRAGARPSRHGMNTNSGALSRAQTTSSIGSRQAGSSRSVGGSPRRGLGLRARA